MRKWKNQQRPGESGQTATEYMLAISVLVLALMVATSAFYDPRGPFHEGMRALSNNISNAIAEAPS